MVELQPAFVSRQGSALAPSEGGVAEWKTSSIGIACCQDLRRRTARTLPLEVPPQ